MSNLLSSVDVCEPCEFVKTDGNKHHLYFLIFEKTKMLFRPKEKYVPMEKILVTILPFHKYFKDSVILNSRLRNILDGLPKLTVTNLGLD